MAHQQALPINKKLQNAWYQRWNQSIDEAMASLAQIQTENNWTQLEIDDLQKFGFGDSAQFYMEALLLKGSLLRAQGFGQKSSAWIRRLIAKNSSLENPETFNFLFEYALDCWRREDTARALELFLLADQRAPSIIEKLFSQSNILWCLENLDLERKHIEVKILRLLEEVPASEQVFVRNVKEQWNAYQARKNFYSHMQLSDFEITGQGLFFRKWIAELPYTQTESLLLAESDQTYLWQGSYRLRTLAGIWSPSDKNSVRIGDAIDRIYLWVWKWLASENITKEKLYWTWDSVEQQLDLNELSKENSLLMRNACAWMGLVDPKFKKKQNGILKRLKSIESRNYPLLQTEYALIECLFEKDSSDLVSALNQFPVFARIYSQCKNFDLADDEVLLPRLHKIMNDRFQFKADKNYDVLVNTQEQTIHFIKSDTTINSAKISLLFSLLKSRDYVDFEEVGEFIDTRSIYNLAARVRGLTSKDCLYIKNQRLYKGQGWPLVKIFENEFDDKIPNLLSSYRLEKLNFVGSTAHLQAARALLPSTFTRKQLEKVLKISKATACRMMKEWLKDKIIRKNGQARAVQYCWENYE